MKNDILNVAVVKRDGNTVAFNAAKITTAITKAFIEVKGKDAASAMHHYASSVTDEVVKSILRRGHASIGIEDIQDLVELHLMRSEHFDVARAYIVFRSQQANRRVPSEPQDHALSVVGDDGNIVTVDIKQLAERIRAHAQGLEVDVDAAARQALRDLYNGCSMADVRKALHGAARTLIEVDPAYSKLAARLVIADLHAEVLGDAVHQMSDDEASAAAFVSGIRAGVEAELLDPQMLQFDLDQLASAIRAERNAQFELLGIQTLYDRYLLHVQKRRIEAPQGFFMRIAMGLALREVDREAKAIEFYNLLSSFDFMTSTPTLFNSGTLRPQLSSCFLTTIPDDLAGIYEGIKENALLSKFAGGLGNDWTRVRALRSHIKGTNGESQGVVPFLKVANDTAVAVNQGGRRQGAVCGYLETWHLDIEEFLELRKNTGDDRRRTHDMNTANWIPDLFMKRVIEQGNWTLFTPSECPDLHELYGRAFEKAYVAYEAKAAQGQVANFKVIPAEVLWRKMLTMLFETGHPWITFKDSCNVRSPQQHAGVVHSSNLCTEITLNTSDGEIAVCNLGSVNLARHIKGGGLDLEKLQATVKTAMRMLDNVIDINLYTVKKARDSNLRHRPVGLGVMGYQDALFELRLPFDSEEAVQFANASAEALCFYAYSASADLARERGVYSTFKGSLWDRGVLPQDSLAILAEERGRSIAVSVSPSMDWDALRSKIATHGMRNSNCVAIAPTATIANIVGVDASIEPKFGNLAVKSNLAGEFTIVNRQLVADLKARGLWDAAMLVELKHFDGSVQPIDRVPADLKALYKTAFEIDTLKLIEAAAVRQVWIDQAQSLNIYMKGASGRKLHETYMAAWDKGLKTTYYLRTTSASQAEKATVDAGALNAVRTQEAGKACRIDDPTCEACQ
ncbi:ribonucleoside-diphosphate reductase subunit alpha [Ramlibacter albus]|uniref:Ribonucleoside-diphosphate reductase n=1 Tax=Ramlibacter albus TaxID=2079448 RepID=A0A923MDL7_9BURK|nr:ribonucleoside-diphosphate reductase subunit alpha [Ramlibacter albus]MBC5767606.1 ribonucleoside-diphosphate reductase subunit alpha [Ramlibacter albus]